MLLLALQNRKVHTERQAGLKFENSHISNPLRQDTSRAAQLPQLSSFNVMWEGGYA